MQAHQLFNNELHAKKDIPGPGKYENSIKRSVSAANHIFNSLKKRFMKEDTENPPIGHYNWESSREGKSKSFQFAKSNNKSYRNDQSKDIDNLIGLKTNR